MDMFKELQSLVDANQLLNTENFDKVHETTDGLDGRVTQLEEQIKFLSQPSGDDGLSMAALGDLRKELLD